MSPLSKRSVYLMQKVLRASYEDFGKGDMIPISYSSDFDVAASLRMSLRQTPKYIPSWYLYDKRGSNLFEKILSDNVYYYFKDAEMEVLQTYVKKCVESMPLPCALIEFGSGNSQKTRTFIDTLLERLPVLTYIPIDISAGLSNASQCGNGLKKKCKQNTQDIYFCFDNLISATNFLLEACTILKRDYGDKLTVKMVPKDYDSAINELRYIPGNKIVLWLGGFQNQSVSEMKKRLAMIADSLSEIDVILLTVDITQDPNEAENAYMDPNGISERFYRNIFDRLGREFGCDVANDDIKIEAEYVSSKYENVPSRILVRARSTRKQKHFINGLNITLDLEDGEYINLYEGEGYSFKYTKEQMENIAETSRLKLDMFEDKKHHAALCILKRE